MGSKDEPGPPGDPADNDPDSDLEASEEISEMFEREIRQFVAEEREEEHRLSEMQGSRDSFTTYPGTEPVEYIFARERQNPYPAKLVPLSPKSSSDDGIHEELRELLKNSRETYSDFSIFGNKPSICIQKVAFGEMELVQKTTDGHPKTGGGKIWQSTELNLIESTGHLIKGCMGAGALGMHEAFMHGGIWTSLVGTLVIGALVAYIIYQLLDERGFDEHKHDGFLLCSLEVVMATLVAISSDQLNLMILVKSTHTMYARIRVPRLTFPDLAEAAIATGPAKGLRRLSKVFRYTVDTFLFIEMCGTCSLFELMIARTLKQAFEGGFSVIRNQHLSVRMYVLIISGPLVLLCMLRNLKCLAVAALVAGLFVTICACGTTIYGITSLPEISERPAWKDYHGMFRFAGGAIYSLQGVSITLPLENNMRSPQHFATVLQFGMVAVVLVIAAIGFFGYWSWGEHCESPITLHLPLLTSTVVLQFVLAVMMSITFVIHFWIAFRIIWYYVGKRHRRKRSIWQRFYRVLHVILISSISLAVPDINVMMSTLGAVICSWVAFIFPAFIDCLVTWKDHQKGNIRWSFMRNICIMLFGGVICVGSIVAYIV